LKSNALGIEDDKQVAARRENRGQGQSAGSGRGNLPNVWHTPRKITATENILTGKRFRLPIAIL